MQLRRLKNQYGFTLIEIMIVLAIIAGVITVAAPRLFKNKIKARPAVRKMELLSKQLHQISRVQNKVFRWVIQIGGAEKLSSYWVESAPANTLFLTNKDAEDLTPEQFKEYQQQFKMDTSFFKKKITLPEGLFFFEIESTYRRDSVTEGRGYIHYFPNGLSEESALHIKNQEKLNWTIAIHPLTGHAHLIRKYISLEDLANRD